MSHSKDILPKNVEGNWHGYCEMYWSTGDLMFKGVFVSGRVYGYYEHYDGDGSFNEDWSGYHLDDIIVSADNVEGYCCVWNRVAI